MKEKVFQSTPLREGRLFLCIVIFSLALSGNHREPTFSRIIHYSFFKELFIMINIFNTLPIERTSLIFSVNLWYAHIIQSMVLPDLLKTWHRYVQHVFSSSNRDNRISNYQLRD